MIRRALGIFRKAIIVVLTLGAVGSGMFWCCSGVWSFRAGVLLERHAFYVFTTPSAVFVTLLTSDNSEWLGHFPTHWEVTAYSSLDGSLRMLCWEGNWQISIRRPGSGLVASYMSRLVVPVWVPFILFATYPTIAFIRGPLRGWRRQKRGLCTRCGYNLRGLPEPRCPECGTAFDPPTIPPPLLRADASESAPNEPEPEASTSKS